MLSAANKTGSFSSGVRVGFAANLIPKIFYLHSDAPLIQKTSCSLKKTVSLGYSMSLCKVQSYTVTASIV
jgi:hypothetical protein